MKFLSYFTIVISCVAFLVVPGTAEASDTLAPVVDSVYVLTSPVNNGDSVTVYIVISDDSAGISGEGFPGGTTTGNTQALVSNPSGGQSDGVVFWQHVTGNTYSGKAKINDFAVAGTWKVEYVYAVDHGGNDAYYMHGTDYSATFQVISSNPDSVAPVLNSVTVSPDTVNAGDSITVLIDVTDDNSGVNGDGFPGGPTGNGSTTQGLVSNNSGGQSDCACFWTHVSGNVYSAKAKVSDFAATGFWKVDNVFLVDHAGNPKYYSHGIDYNTTFYVLGATPDTNAPILHSVNVIEDTINAGDSITVVIDIEDTASGVNGDGFPGGSTGGGSTTQARVSNPSNGQIVDAWYWTLVSGNTYSSRIKVSDFAAGGTWKVETVLAVDHALNYKYYFHGTDYSATFYVRPGGAPAPLSLSYTTQNTTTTVSCDGSIDLNISGGVTPYTIAIDSVPDSASITGLCAGIYDIVVTDANSSQINLSVLIAEDDHVIVGSSNWSDSTSTDTVYFDPIKDCDLDYDKIESVEVVTVIEQPTGGVFEVELRIVYEDSITVQYVVDVATDSTVADDIYVGVLSLYCDEKSEIYGHKVIVFNFREGPRSGIDWANQAKLKAFPNPANSVIHLTNAGIGSRYSVYNSLGSKMLEGRISGTNAPVDISGLQNGVYLLQVIGSNGSQSIRVVKQ